MILQDGSYDTPFDAMLQDVLDRLWARLYLIHEFDKVLAAIMFATHTRSQQALIDATSHIVCGHLGFSSWDQARPFMAGLSVGLHDMQNDIQQACEASADGPTGFIPEAMVETLINDGHMMAHLVADRMSYSHSIACTLLLAWELDHPGSLKEFTDRMALRNDDHHPENHY